jgi:hypothetical protein
MAVLQGGHPMVVAGACVSVCLLRSDGGGGGNGGSRGNWGAVDIMISAAVVSDVANRGSFGNSDRSAYRSPRTPPL